MKTLIVPKWLHICINQLPLPVSTNSLKKDIIFTEDSIYELDEVNQWDWNKLMGFSIGLFPRKWKRPMWYNSVRLGWRWLNNSIQICPYTYSKSVRDFNYEPLNLELNKKYTIKINQDHKKSIFSIEVLNENTLIGLWSVDLKTTIDDKYGWSACLFFGGNKRAPKCIKIKMG